MTSLPSDSELGLFRDEPHLVIHHLMNLLEVSDVEMGERMGISRQAVYKIRSGRSNLSAARLKRVADALGVPAVLLMTTPAAAIREVLNRIETGDDDGGPGENVTTLRSSPAGVVQWESGDILPKAA